MLNLTSANELRAELLALPAEERAELAHVLLESLRQEDEAGARRLVDRIGSTRPSRRRWNRIGGRLARSPRTHRNSPQGAPCDSSFSLKRKLSSRKQRAGTTIAGNASATSCCFRFTPPSSSSAKRPKHGHDGRTCLSVHRTFDDSFCRASICDWRIRRS